MMVNTAASPDQSTTNHSVLATNNRRIEIDELDAATSRLSRHMNASNYQLMVLIREFDERAGWLKWGFNKGLSWLCWRCDLSVNAARDKLRVAHALKDLPAMSAAFIDSAPASLRNRQD